LTRSAVGVQEPPSPQEIDGTLRNPRRQIKIRDKMRLKHAPVILEQTAANDLIQYVSTHAALNDIPKRTIWVVGRVFRTNRGRGRACIP